MKYTQIKPDASGFSIDDSTSLAWLVTNLCVWKNIKNTINKKEAIKGKLFLTFVLAVTLTLFR